MRLVLASLVAALALAGCGGSSSTAPVDDGANLWVAPTGAEKPARCDTPCAFDPDKAYQSFQDAYTAAGRGDLIRVRAGSYGTQPIATPTPELTKPVTFEPAQGEEVALARLE